MHFMAVKLDLSALTKNGTWIHHSTEEDPKDKKLKLGSIMHSKETGEEVETSDKEELNTPLESETESKEITNNTTSDNDENETSSVSSWIWWIMPKIKLETLKTKQQSEIEEEKPMVRPQLWGESVLEETKKEEKEEEKEETVEAQVGEKVSSLLPNEKPFSWKWISLKNIVDDEDEQQEKKKIPEIKPNLTSDLEDENKGSNFNSTVIGEQNFMFENYNYRPKEEKDKDKKEEKKISLNLSEKKKDSSNKDSLDKNDSPKEKSKVKNRKILTKKIIFPSISVWLLAFVLMFLTQTPLWNGMVNGVKTSVFDIKEEEQQTIDDVNNQINQQQNNQNTDNIINIQNDWSSNNSNIDNSEIDDSEIDNTWSEVIDSTNDNDIGDNNCENDPNCNTDSTINENGDDVKRQRLIDFLKKKF